MPPESRDTSGAQEASRSRAEPGAAPAPARAFAGARPALVLLLGINLLNYIDRQVLAAVVPDIRRAFLDSAKESGETAVAAFFNWFQQAFGFRPENALLGLLSMAFMVVYMVAAPVFGWQADRRP